MGISRDSTHKHRSSGGKRKSIRMKRKFEMGRPPAMTKLGAKRIHEVRTRGGSIKHRALRLDAGNFSWGSETCTRKTRILSVVYNASNNELVRTNTLVKGCIVQIDATPFRQFYKDHYGHDLSQKKVEETTEKKSKHVLAKQAARNKDKKLDAHITEQFGVGRLLACVASRPGQSGRCDGYILEGHELDFYNKKIYRKKR